MYQGKTSWSGCKAHYLPLVRKMNALAGLDWQNKEQPAAKATAV